MRSSRTCRQCHRRWFATIPSAVAPAFTASHASHIVGRPVEEGRALIEELIAFATQPQFVYQHRWTVGDLVTWDNRCTMHRGRPYDDKQRRVLHRTTVSDVANTLEQEELVEISDA
jgi:alpha-ketoglutarate-dependent 2,4-dichlorophenoxyacetate dioxygenase